MASENNSARIAVSNHKGGVGKTTVTAHVAASLAQSEKDVLVVDLDPQGTLSMHFSPTIGSLRKFRDRGVLSIENRQLEIAKSHGGTTQLDLNRRLPSVYEAFYERKMIDTLAIRLISGSESEYEQYANMRGFQTGPVKENIVVETTDGVDIIPANTQMKGLEKVLAGESDAVMRLNGILNELGGYDYVLLDTPATVGLLKDSSIVASENVIIPMQAEGTSASATKQHLEDLEDMEGDGSFGLDINIISIVPNEVRDDGEADKVLNIIRKQLPTGWKNKNPLPEDFDVSTLPDEFWTGEVYGDDRKLIDRIPEEFENFWPEMGCSPLITDERDYTECVTPFEIRTRVAIRRAFSHNRTLYTHNEECDMKDNYDRIAQLVIERAEVN